MIGRSVSSRPGLGPATAGVTSLPVAMPSPAAVSPRSRYSASKTVLTTPGVAPTALSKPARRVCSDARCEARTAAPASADIASSQPPTRASVRCL
nr:hypothetical protein [Amycolatopsis sp. CB00013]